MRVNLSSIKVDASQNSGQTDSQVNLEVNPRLPVINIVKINK